MESKLSLAVLCFIGFFVIVQSLSAKPEDFAKYEKCFVYANCLDEKGPENIGKCMKMMKPQELKSLYQDVKDYYQYTAPNIYGGIHEYCEIDDSTKPKVYTNSLKGHKLYEKDVCDDESSKGACNRFSEHLGCILQYLDKLKQEGKCQLNA